jgi:hypothetical protein
MRRSTTRPNRWPLPLNDRCRDWGGPFRPGHSLSNFTTIARPSRRAFSFSRRQTMSAQNIFDIAPLGACIRFFDGEPRPPERFKRKLARWKDNNDTGRLTAKSPASQMGSHHSTASFALHMGSYGSNGVTILTVTRHFSVNNPLHFEIFELPAPGSVRVLQTRGDRVELLHLASNTDHAAHWLAEHHYSNTVLETVGSGDLPALPLQSGRAA